MHSVPFFITFAFMRRLWIFILLLAISSWLTSHSSQQKKPFVFRLLTLDKFVSLHP